MIAFIFLSKILLLQTHSVFTPMPNNHVYHTHEVTLTDIDIERFVCTVVVENPQFKRINNF